ncbi:enamine deaminase RidA (YjgF/YER057c/UK114 family) [Phyllobacterium myrsinacearum]|uniref:RidA family protein n=1 Tax=Phyllobacterium myrsinacearum TaxID=28101 RepID=UPI0010E84657|nr:enamine deaminase RidA (YjgF/YER057c/UK114 family) [Phyllobacterium myrsinacearum]
MIVKRHVQTPIMHRVVEAAGLIFIGGTTADDKSAGIEGQTNQILSKLEKLLQQGGSDKNHVVQATIYLSDLSLKAEMNEVWTRWFAADSLPARAAVGVAELAKGTLVEITFIAAKV